MFSQLNANQAWPCLDSEIEHIQGDTAIDHQQCSALKFNTRILPLEIILKMKIIMMVLHYFFCLKLHMLLKEVNAGIVSSI